MQSFSLHDSLHHGDVRSSSGKIDFFAIRNPAPASRPPPPACQGQSSGSAGPKAPAQTGTRGLRFTLKLAFEEISIRNLHSGARLLLRSHQAAELIASNGSIATRSFFWCDNSEPPLMHPTRGVHDLDADVIPHRVLHHRCERRTAFLKRAKSTKYTADRPSSTSTRRSYSSTTDCNDWSSDQAGTEGGSSPPLIDLQDHHRSGSLCIVQFVAAWRIEVIVTRTRVFVLQTGRHRCAVASQFDFFETLCGEAAAASSPFSSKIFSCPSSFDARLCRPRDGRLANVNERLFDRFEVLRDFL